MAIIAACTPPALFPDLKIAEKHLHAGEYEQALTAYDRAIVSCLKIKDEAKRLATCSEAHLGRAELLDRLGRREQAAADRCDRPQDNAAEASGSDCYVQDRPG